MSYYDNIEAYVARGIDYDLASCLQYNPQDFELDDIDRVLAVFEGENDGDSWRWVILLNDGRYIAFEGSCDYSGWDCQSGADNTAHATAIGAAMSFDVVEVRESLLLQVFDTKSDTWREIKDREFGFV